MKQLKDTAVWIGLICVVVAIINGIYAYKSVETGETRVAALYTE